MPSLRKRVTSYFRQLSFHNEPRERRLNLNENSFITKYLQGQIKLKDGPPVISGKNPADLPNYDLEFYTTGPDSIIGCYTGPHGGLTTVKRTEKHLSVADPDIDFIDTQEDNTSVGAKPARNEGGFPIDNTSMVIKVAGQEYFVTNRKKQHSKSQSLGSLSNFNVEIETTKIDPNFHGNNNNNSNNNNNNNSSVRSSVSSDGFLSSTQVKSDGGGEVKTQKPVVKVAQKISSDLITCDNQGGYNEAKPQMLGDNAEIKKQRRKSEVGNGKKHEVGNGKKHEVDNSRKHEVGNGKHVVLNKESVSDDVRKPQQADSYELSKSKSEGNPFQHRKRGRIIQVQRPISTVSGSADNNESSARSSTDFLLPEEWSSKSDWIYGLSDSLYDRNQITKSKNGDPIADCFGIIGRKDSAILAVADGVNWGEKACIAAKSAIHGCLHYLNRTIFNDTKPFENLVKCESRDSPKCETPLHNTRVMNTQEVFVCLLRAFNCAHDLILENNGMLTTLTVAVVLPLKQSNVSARTRESLAETEKNELLSYVCCVCNVGDTLAYVYSKKHGVRELTKGSHDIHCNRDMRDALGALGPVDGINPELSNLTLSITTVHKGDIIFLASDGLTDNFDPNVCKFTVNTNLSEPIKAKRPAGKDNRPTHPQKQPPGQRPASTERQQQHRSHESKSPRKTEPPVKPPRRYHAKNAGGGGRASRGEKGDDGLVDEISKTINEMTKIVNRKIPEQAEAGACKTELNSKQNEEDGLKNNPLVVQFLRDNSIDESDSFAKCKQTLPPSKPGGPPQLKPVRKPTTSQKSTSISTSASSQNKTSSMTRANPPEIKAGGDPPKYSFLRSKTSIDLRGAKTISRNEDGLPYVSPVQRYELTLLLMEDILRHGISGRETGCVDAQQLCENLLNFTFSITAAKRHTLEDNDLYFDNQNGLLVEVSSQEKKVRRKKGLERVQNLPGKLDHVTVVAFNVGNFAV